jgi:hypothetical protein
MASKWMVAFEREMAARSFPKPRADSAFSADSPVQPVGQAPIGTKDAKGTVGGEKQTSLAGALDRVADTFAKLQSRILETAAEWRAEYEGRVAYGLDQRHSRADAERMAWNAVAAIWYRHHGKRVQGALCAGCGKPLSGTDAADVLLLPHGERAHAEARPDGYLCIAAYGRRWKREAATALAAMGIKTPAGD